MTQMKINLKKRLERLSSKYIGKLCKIAHPAGINVTPKDQHFLYRVEKCDTKNRYPGRVLKSLRQLWRTTVSQPLTITEDIRVLVIDVVRETDKYYEPVNWSAIILFEQNTYLVSMRAVSLGDT